MRLVSHFALVGVLATMLAGCASKTPDPTADAERALKDAKRDTVKVDWDKEARIAHLKGTVDSTADRVHAGEVAGTVVGTTGTILNELVIKGLNEHTAD